MKTVSDWNSYDQSKETVKCDFKANRVDSFPDASGTEEITFKGVSFSWMVTRGNRVKAAIRIIPNLL